MDIQADPHNASLLRALAGPDGILEQGELHRLDAADGRKDGQFHLAGLTPDETAWLQQAQQLGNAVGVQWVDGATAIDWDNEAIQEAYGEFLKQRWETWKANGEEADCKTLALRMMEDFRIHLRKEAGLQLADPVPARQRGKWVQYGPQRPGPLPRTVPAGVRADYVPFQGKPLLSGPNHFYQHILADTVARQVTQPVAVRNGQATIIRYQRKKPPLTGTQAFLDPFPAEGTRMVNPQALRAGDILFQNHRAERGRKQDQRIDHTMHVVGVDRDSDTGRVQRLVIAMGTYDDLKDFNEGTAPTVNRLNNYAFEAVIEFDEDGDVADCRVPWQSDPFISIEPVLLVDRIRMAYGILGVGEHWIGVHRWR